MNTAYDAIIVGARCAGSPTAMLLARYTVLVVDRATFPSDTVSTHVNKKDVEGHFLKMFDLAPDAVCFRR